ncbi:MAG: hypothetical protein RDU20_02315 [Desulfomonilaceae bacterium]|nr:hypothetical protein [Desulfomonilaceae bacterium]
MSNTATKLASAACGVIAAFVIAWAVPAVGAFYQSHGDRSSGQPAVALIGGESQGQGYVLLARRGAIVRDHRSCAPNCGPYIPRRPRPYQRPSAVSPGDGQGGVTVTPSNRKRGIPCFGDLC